MIRQATAKKFNMALLAVALGLTAQGCTADKAVAPGGEAKAGAQAEGVPLDLAGPASPTPWKRYGGWPKDDWAQYTTLRENKPTPISAEHKIEGELKGDPEKGKKLVADRSRGGSCLACHILPGQPLPGNIGLDLSTVGTWGRSDEYLFNRIYDARGMNKDTVMPPWGAHGIYTKEEIGDMVAYLKTLKEPTVFKDKLEDPNTRPAPVEDRDNMDPFVNPGMDAVDAGKALFDKAGPNGQSCRSCHEKPEEAFKSWAAHMPNYEPRLKKVLGVEEFVTRHARATTGAEYLAQSKENTAFAVYLRYLANGQPIHVDLEKPENKAAIARAQEFMGRKLGQINMACNDCHVTAANKWTRGQYLGKVEGMMDHFPTYRTSRAEIWDIRKRLQWCNVSIRANELPPDAPEYGDLELYLASRNEGKLFSVPGIRH